MLGELLAVLIACLIVVLAYRWLVAPSARALLAKSSGGFDEPARRAYDGLVRTRRPTPADLVTRADIVRFNILEGEVRHPRIHEAVADYHGAIMALDQLEPQQAEQVVIAAEDLFLQLALAFGPYQPPDALLFGQELQAAAPTAHQVAAIERATEAAAQSETRGEAIQAYFDASQHYSDAQQTVHDPAVIGDLRDVLRRISDGRSGEAPAVAISDCRAYIQQNRVRLGAKADAAAQALDKMAEGGAISTFGTTEDAILAKVWWRCGHPANVANRELLRDALVDALADCVQNGALVCANGRTARVLNCMVLLDHDPAIGAAMTSEAYRNQIFQEVSQMIQAEIDSARADPKTEAVAAAYDDPSLDDAALESPEGVQFKAKIRAGIDKIIGAYRDRLSAADLRSVTEQCYMYATL